MRHDVVVVTGASAGLGRAIAQQFARQGSRIALIARNRARLEEARAEVASLGGKALVLPMDVGECGALERTATRVEEELGPIDCWINNAMVSVNSAVKDMDPEEFLRVTEVTYLGYVYGTLAALKRMLPRNRGVVLQVGSAEGRRGVALQSAYRGAKQAMVGFTDALREELEHDGTRVRVSMVHLPPLNTPRHQWSRNRVGQDSTPDGPLFDPEVGARAVLHAAEHDVGRELTLAWPSLVARLGDLAAPLLSWRSGEEARQPADAHDVTPSLRGRDNLWETVRGPYGVRGPFSASTSVGNAELWVRKHRDLLAVAGAAVAGVMLGALRSRHERERVEHRGSDHRSSDRRGPEHASHGGMGRDRDVTPGLRAGAAAQGTTVDGADNPNAGALASSAGAAWHPAELARDDDASAIGTEPVGQTRPTH